MMLIVVCRRCLVEMPKRHPRRGPRLSQAPTSFMFTCLHTPDSLLMDPTTVVEGTSSKGTSMMRFIVLLAVYFIHFALRCLAAQYQ